MEKTVSIKVSTRTLKQIVRRACNLEQMKIAIGFTEVNNYQPLL